MTPKAEAFALTNLVFDDELVPGLTASVDVEFKSYNAYDVSLGFAALTTVTMTVNALLRKYTLNERERSNGSIQQGDTKASFRLSDLSPNTLSVGDQILNGARSLNVVSVISRPNSNLVIAQCRE